MNKLHRFASDGRYLGFIVQDRPIEDYASRMDVELTTEEPPTPDAGNWPYRVAGAWVQQSDPPSPAPPTPTRPPAPAPAP